MSVLDRIQSVVKAEQSQQKKEFSTINLRINPGLKVRLKYFAEEQGLALNRLVEIILSECLEAYEATSKTSTPQFHSELNTEE